MHKVTLLSLHGLRAAEAVEILEDFIPLPHADELGSISPTPEQVHRAYQTVVQHIVAGNPFVLQVPDQKTLNILAGYFWVEPRRLPPPEAPSLQEWQPQDDVWISLDDKTAEHRDLDVMDQMVEEIRGVANRYNFDLHSTGTTESVRRFLQRLP